MSTHGISRITRAAKGVVKKPKFLDFLQKKLKTQKVQILRFLEKP